MSSQDAANLPEWFRSMVIYSVFPRSFADSNGDGIGDLNGITHTLDYIQRLGPDTIWLTPIYKSSSAHGYDIEDYFALNEAYGTMDDLRELVKAVHERGMRILLDFVPSHSSDKHPFFRDAHKNPKSQYSDWYLWKDDKHEGYQSYQDLGNLPRLNHSNPAVVDHLCKAAGYWINLGRGDGNGEQLDGLRVDNVVFPPHEFHKAFRNAVKFVKPDAFLLGELTDVAAENITDYLHDEYDAIFDMNLLHLGQGNTDAKGDGLMIGHDDPIHLSNLLNYQKQVCPPPTCLVRLFGSHDTNRIASEVHGDDVRMRLTVAFLGSLPSPVMFYYGDEIGMWGEKAAGPPFDIPRREPFVWHAGHEAKPPQTTWLPKRKRGNKPHTGVSVEEQEKEGKSLLNYYRKILELHKSHSALSVGDFYVLELEANALGPWGLARVSNEETIVCVMHFGRDEQEITIKSFPIHGPIGDLITETRYSPSEKDKPYKLKLTPGQIVYLGYYP